MLKITRLSPTMLALPYFSFKLVWRIPIRLLHLPIPSEKRFFGIWVTLPELPERLLGDDPHKLYELFPF